MSDEYKTPAEDDQGVAATPGAESAAAASDAGAQAAEDAQPESVAEGEGAVRDDAAAAGDDLSIDADDSDDGEEPERLYTKADVDALLRESQDRMLRVMAEYDNFRRRTAREKEQWITDALEDFVKDLLPVFDSFDKARESGAADGATVASMTEGLDITHKQLRGVLGKYAIDVIDPVGEPFDPTYHEALMRQPSPDHEPGTVVTVFERGYKMGSRLLRAARTVVAAGD